MIKRLFLVLLTLTLGGYAAAQVAIPRVVAPKHSGGGGPTTTWSPTALATDIVLSNGNLTATSAATAPPYQSGLATNAVPTGKYFWSTTVVSNNPGEDNSMGFANSTFRTDGGGNYNDWLGDTSNSLGYYPPTGNVYYNYSVTGTNVFNLGSGSPGSIVDFAVDTSANLAWIRLNGGNWNGSGTANPATGTGGVSISTIGTIWPAYTLSTNPSISALTVNFGASSYTYAPPAGFSNLP